MSTQIQSLIAQLKHLHVTKAHMIKCIVDFDGLILSLQELDNLIEMDNVKLSIINQIRFLLLQQIRDKKDFEGVMLHTVVTGPPGVGKTSVGLILAKIWRSIGIIRGSKTPSFSPELEEWKSKCETKNEELRRRIIILGALSTKLRLNLLGVGGCMLDISNKEGIKKIARVDWESLRDEIDEIGSITESIGIHATLPQDSTISPPPPNIATIVSRKDFVAEYVGHTAPKTKALLEANVGRVLFVDEAYSLIQGDRDTFGMEALTELNRFMSERPRDIVVIFAGYKELLDRTVFTEQPGLLRRFTWSFNIEGYSPAGLALIFTKQLSLHGWSVDPNIDLKRFFEYNKEKFPGYGGDTERFAFFCKIAYAQTNLDDAETGDDIIREGHLQVALDLLKIDRPLSSDGPPPAHLYM